MLGRFLELSVATDDIRESLDFYRKLGFVEAAVGDAWSHPYAVVSDGRIAVGLHQKADFVPSLTFVKAGLLQHSSHLESLGVTFDIRRLGDGVFNELGWFEASGQLLRLVEARTFSPVERRSSERSACGHFSEIALPDTARESARSRWEQLGFVAMDEADGLLPHVGCTSDTIDVGLYPPEQIHSPTLFYEIDDVHATRTALVSSGVKPLDRLRGALPRAQTLQIVAPEGTPILMMAAP